MKRRISIRNRFTLRFRSRKVTIRFITYSNGLYGGLESIQVRLRGKKKLNCRGTNSINGSCSGNRKNNRWGTYSKFLIRSWKNKG